jgi:hypothetical protein
MAVEGVDYAFPPNPAPAVLAAAGKAFACRYGGPGSASKQLTADELAALSAAGIAVVANAEGTTGGLKGGYAAGRSWAQQADDHFRALGMPADRPIYLSVDFDAGSADWPALEAAMDGAGSVLGRGRVGVYGGYDVIAHFVSMKDRLATWYWQTYAWSGGRWHPAAHIQQYRNGVTLAGADCDLNRAMVADYGQWGVEADMTPSQGYVQHVMNYRLDAIRGNKPVCVVPPYTAPSGDQFPGFTEPNQLAIAVIKLLDDEANITQKIHDEIQRAVDAMKDVTLTDEQINRLAVQTAAGVTTAIDVPTPQENAAAVLDAEAARLAE